MAAYPQIYWKLSTVKKICKRVDQQAQRLNARLAVVGRNAHARTQTSRMCGELRFFPTSTELPAPEHLSTHETAANLDISLSFIMTAVSSRCGHYILPCGFFYLLSFFHSLISAVAHWMYSLP